MIKKLIKKSVVNTANRLLAHAVLGTKLRAVVPIFMLHRLTDVEAGTRGHDTGFVERALIYLQAQGYQAISTHDLLAALDNNQSLPPNPLVFTCDDGYYDQSEALAEYFIRYGFPITLFLITDFIDGKLWPWDSKLHYVLHAAKRDVVDYHLKGETQTFAIASEQGKIRAERRIVADLKTRDPAVVSSLIGELADQLGVEIPMHPPAAYRPMSWERARALEAQGVDFGPHGRTHMILAQSDDAKVEQEISGSWARLTAELRRPVKLFCYPVGRRQDFSARDIASLQHQGFAAAVSAEPGYVDLRKTIPYAERFALPRFSFPDNIDDLKQICNKLEYIKTILRRSRH